MRALHMPVTTGPSPGPADSTGRIADGPVTLQESSQATFEFVRFQMDPLVRMNVCVLPRGALGLQIGPDLNELRIRELFPAFQPMNLVGQFRRCSHQREGLIEHVIQVLADLQFRNARAL
jgi:hypothetical protein